MACGRRREPEGIYQSEDDGNLGTQGTLSSPVTTNYWQDSSYGENHSDDDENMLSRQLNSVSLNEDEHVAPSQNWSSMQDVSVCLHQGSPGVSPVLITLPFQDGDHLQNFVPCTVCHLPNVATPGPGATEVVTFCVSEVNIRTSQLILVPCYVCWKSRPVTGMPEQIKVPLFHSTLNGGAPTSQFDNSLRFVPCSVCLLPEHASLVMETQSPRFESRSQQTSSQGIQTRDYDFEVEDTERRDQETPVSWFIPFNRRTEGRSLQMAFLLHCRQVVSQVRQRQRELPQKAFLRLQASSERIVSTAQPQVPAHKVPDYTSYQPFSHSQMRNHTERIYRNLPEVKEQQLQRLVQQSRKTHRIMAYIFQKKIQQATLRGKVSWQITESCM